LNRVLIQDSIARIAMANPSDGKRTAPFSA
jgi:hypothetical protein